MSGHRCDKDNCGETAVHHVLSSPSYPQGGEMWWFACEAHVGEMIEMLKADGERPRVMSAEIYALRLVMSR